MKRCLIIIGNEGSGTSFLPGVRRDVNSYLSYFKSDNGGAWEDSEIVDKNYNWSCLGLSAELLNRRMDRDGLDYALIVFAGHGYAERNGEIYFELSNEEILSLTTLKSFLPTQKVLLIADSCQCYIEDSECENRALFEMRLFAQSGDLNRRYALKQRYNALIEQMTDRTFVFASAVSPGEAANDTSKGGLYSKILLSLADSMKDNAQDSYISMKEIHDCASTIVSTYTHYAQNPKISIDRASNYPPFFVK